MYVVVFNHCRCLGISFSVRPTVSPFAQNAHPSVSKYIPVGSTSAKGVPASFARRRAIFSLTSAGKPTSSAETI